ncbi:hypothetical protein Dimus_039321 [Dionaea muscipula]
MAKILHVINCKGAFGLLGVQLVGSQDFQGGPQMIDMHRHGRAIDQNIVKEYQNELPQIRLINVIHQGLKCGRRVGQAERHHPEFIMAAMSSEGSLVLIALLHSDLVVATP